MANNAANPMRPFASYTHPPPFPPYTQTHTHFAFSASLGTTRVGVCASDTKTYNPTVLFFIMMRLWPWRQVAFSAKFMPWQMAKKVQLQHLRTPSSNRSWSLSELSPQTLQTSPLRLLMQVLSPLCASCFQPRVLPQTAKLIWPILGPHVCISSGPVYTQFLSPNLANIQHN